MMAGNSNKDKSLSRRELLINLKHMTGGDTELWDQMRGTITDMFDSLVLQGRSSGRKGKGKDDLVGHGQQVPLLTFTAWLNEGWRGADDVMLEGMIGARQAKGRKGQRRTAAGDAGQAPASTLRPSPRKAAALKTFTGYPLHMTPRPPPPPPPVEPEYGDTVKSDLDAPSAKISSVFKALVAVARFPSPAVMKVATKATARMAVRAQVRVESKNERAAWADAVADGPVSFQSPRRAPVQPGAASSLLTAASGVALHAGDATHRQHAEGQAKVRRLGSPEPLHPAASLRQELSYMSTHKPWADLLAMGDDMDSLGDKSWLDETLRHALQATSASHLSKERALHSRRSVQTSLSSGSTKATATFARSVSVRSPGSGRGKPTSQLEIICPPTPSHYAPVRSNPKAHKMLEEAPIWRRLRAHSAHYGHHFQALLETTFGDREAEEACESDHAQTVISFEAAASHQRKGVDGTDCSRRALLCSAQEYGASRFSDLDVSSQEQQPPEAAREGDDEEGLSHHALASWDGALTGAFARNSHAFSRGSVDMTFNVEREALLQARRSHEDAEDIYDTDSRSSSPFTMRDSQSQQPFVSKWAIVRALTKTLHLAVRARKNVFLNEDARGTWQEQTNEYEGAANHSDQPPEILSGLHLGIGGWSQPRNQPATGERRNHPSPQQALANGVASRKEQDRESGRQLDPTVSKFVEWHDAVVEAMGDAPRASSPRSNSRFIATRLPLRSRTDAAPHWPGHEHAIGIPRTTALLTKEGDNGGGDGILSLGVKGEMKLHSVAAKMLYPHIYGRSLFNGDHEMPGVRLLR